MKIGIFSPYLPKHYGGGEKHVLATASYLSQKNEVSILIPTHTTPDQIVQAQTQYESLFSLDLSRVHWQPSTLADRTMKPWNIWSLTRQFDAFLYATDGSVFFSGAKRNILHIQIPFTNTQNFLNRLKLRSWNVINTNSEFTKKVIEKSWKIDVNEIHYPYVDTRKFSINDASKRRFILAVGRFYDPIHTDVHAKRQDILIDTFKQGCRELGWDKRNWQLHLVGSVEPGSVHEEFVRKLKKSAAGFPIFFHHDLPHDELQELYAKSMIFWHAAGFAINETINPQRVEHFGMSTIEAMAAGAIPIVTNKGGLKETVEHGVNGFCFDTKEELLSFTSETMNLKPEIRQNWQRMARKKAESFSLKRFNGTIERMFYAKK